MFGNVSDKRRSVDVEGDDVCSSTGVGGTILVLGLPLNEAHVILGCILYAI